MTKTNRLELRGHLPKVNTVAPDFRATGHGHTDVGMRREANEDSFLMIPNNHLWIVADGMGGHAGGQQASRLTIEVCGKAVIRRLAQAEALTKANGNRVNVAVVLDQAIREACATVYDTAQENPALMGMGSTVTLMLIYGSFAWFGHVGDSRAYLVRDGAIQQVTEDHSLVQEQVTAGLITPAQAKVSMMRNIITRSIGFERDVKVDVAAMPLLKGDVFVLCSDGLTGHVDDPEILSVVLNQDARTVPRTLVSMANAGGGDDNSTVISVTVKSTRGKQRRKHQAKRTQ